MLSIAPDSNKIYHVDRTRRMGSWNSSALGLLIGAECLKTTWRLVARHLFTTPFEEKTQEWAQSTAALTMRLGSTYVVIITLSSNTQITFLSQVHLCWFSRHHFCRNSFFRRISGICDRTSSDSTPSLRTFKFLDGSFAFLLSDNPAVFMGATKVQCIALELNIASAHTIMQAVGTGFTVNEQGHMNAAFPSR